MSGRLRWAALGAGLLFWCAGPPEGLVDRVEDGHAVVVAPDGSAMEIDLAELGAEVREGDWLVAGRPHAKAAQWRRARTARLRAELSADDRGGTITLE